jgi:4-hydroxybenzoate polyprenyltransferase
MRIMARSSSKQISAAPAGAGGGGQALLRLIRFPNLLIMTLCLALVQSCLLRPAAPLTALLSGRFLLLALAALSIAAAGYIINDYYDVKIDVINRPDRLVVGRVVNRRHAMLAHLLLSGFGVLLAGALSPVLGLVNMGSALLLWGYSARFKRLALVGNLSIALLTAALVLLPELQVRTGQTIVWVYALAAFLLTVVREIVKDVEDMRGDAEHDCRTLPIVWGVARTKWAVGFFLFNLVVLVAGGIADSLYEQRWALGGWLLLTVLVPALVMGRYLARADRRRDFTQLSAWCKWIMLAGVLSMVLVALD